MKYARTMKELTPETFLPLIKQHKPLVFLDSSRPDSANSSSYLFYDPVTVIQTCYFNEVPSALAQIDKYAPRYWLAGFIAYEAAYALEDKLRRHLPRRTGSPLVWFGVFRQPACYDHKKNTWHHWNLARIRHARTHVPQTISVNVKPTCSRAEYARRIRSIKRWIGRGHTYQVNFTFNTRLRVKCAAPELYAYEREHQKTPFGAFIDTGTMRVLSFSPELFFKREGSRIEVKPMKGTAPRGRWATEDAQIQYALQRDIKNRSENIMIVDLLRNDLGRISRHGTVRPRRLFEIETHPTVHQMTSTIQGRLRENIQYKDIFTALFPSGSVTGAPKIRTMEIIRTLERGPRGVYCGAIGYISPQRRATFSVPIRILQKRNREAAWTFRVGSGIVWDSKAGAEWAECQAKSQFLTMQGQTSFELFETLLWDGRFVYWHDHLERLSKSAYFFGFPFSRKHVNTVIRQAQQTLRQKRKCRVRLVLNYAGEVRWEAHSLHTPPLHERKHIRLATQPINETAIFLYHKTTHRPWYDEAMRDIQKNGYFDVIFYNRQGQLTEGARTNIFVERKGKLFTPPVRCGLLPGILRQRLIKTHKCVERVLYPEDLQTAHAVYCGNSVRGLCRVFLK